MPRQNAIQNSWVKGEVSPLARGRSDVNLYSMGAATIENLIVRPQGPVFRRSGTKFVRSTKFPTQRARIIPFTVSDTTAYELEFGAGYIHFYKNKEPLLESTNAEIEAWTPETASDGSGLMTIVVDPTGVTRPDRLPGWGDINAFYAATANNGDCTISNNAGTVRLTTTIPNTLRTGVYVCVRSTELTTIDGSELAITNIANNGSGGVRITIVGHPYINGNTIAIQTTIAGYKGTWVINNVAANTFDLIGAVFSSGVVVGQSNRVWQITRISAYAMDLVGSVYAAPGAGNTAVFSHGLLAGDRVFFSGGAQYPLLAESFQTVQSVPQFDRFVVANRTYANLGAPTLEEVWTIPIEVFTTFTETELADIRVTQSADVLYIFHPAHAPQKLARLSNDGDRNDWLLSTVVFNDGPYLPLNDLSPNIDTTTPANGAVYQDVYMEVSSYAHTATVTSATAFAAGAPSADSSLYLEYRSGDQWKLAQMQAGLAGGATTGTITIIDNVLIRLDESTRLKQKSDSQVIPGSTSNSPVYPVNQKNRTNKAGYTPAAKIDPRDFTTGIVAGGALTSQFSNTFSLSDIGKYVRFTTNVAGIPVVRWAQIIGPITASGATAATSAAIAMVSNSATGKFVISNESRTATITAYRAGTAFAAFTLVSDVGRLIRLGFAGRWTWGKILTVVSTSQVTVQLYDDMPRDTHDARNIAGHNYGIDPAGVQSTTATTTGMTYDWRMGAWSGTTGYPACGCFHEQRLWMANNTVAPSAVWGSVSGDFENMQPTQVDSTVLDDDAITLELASTKAQAIKWMVSGPTMTIGTNSGEWQLRASSSINDGLTPSNVKATEYTAHGVLSATLPTRIGPSVIFVDRSGEKVHELLYQLQTDAVESDDLTVISEHIMREHGGAVSGVYQQKPHSIYWVVCADGTLSAMTFNKKQEVVAWHHHTIQGGLVEDISVIPSADASEDEVWMVVNRTINGATARYIEVLESDYYPASSSSRLLMKFLDSHRYISGFTGTTITGLNYLEAQSVVVVKDGTRIAGTFTVTSGAITIASAATSELLVGLLGNANLQSLPPEGGGAFGTSQGQTKRIIALDTRFYNTDSVSFGPANDLTRLITKTLPTNPNWFTGTERLIPAGGYDEEAAWYIRQADPYPLNVLFTVVKLETHE